MVAPLKGFRRLLCWALIGIWTLLPQITQAGLVDPKLKWYTLTTEHFNINYYEGEEEVAYRMATIAEKVYAELVPKWKWKPWGRTEIVITDTTGISNALTTPIPYNYILFFVTPPQGDSTLNYYENWLEDIFRHEFVHVLHLDMYGGPNIPLRWVFGRLVTPNALTPGWVREGISTQQESLTGKGRVHNSFSAMMLRVDIYNNQFLSLDQMAGNQFTWPGSNAAYIYGGKFWAYLADTYGQDKVVEFSKRYSDSIWLFSLNNKARKTFDNKNFFMLHREWKAGLTEKFEKLRQELVSEGLTPLEEIKQIKGVISNPTLSRDGKYLLYTQVNYFDPPELRIRRTDGTEDKRIKKKVIGNQFSFSPDGKKVIYSRIARYRGYYLYYDIYELDLKTKKSKRVTYGKRAFHPDYSPDGKKIVYASNKLTTTQLFLWDIEEKKASPLTKPQKAVQFSNPRFSPDGKLIAVSQWKKGQRDIYLYDLEGNVVTQVTNDTAIDNNPSFSPDGKNLFYSSDLTGITNIYRYELNPGVTERITNVLTGLFSPQYANGKIYLKHYFGRGYDLKSMDYDPTAPGIVAAIVDLAIMAVAEAAESRKVHEEIDEAMYTDLLPTEVPDLDLEPKKYNPFRKLYPRYIQPGFFFTDDTFLLSGSIGSLDPILRHQWSAGVTYRSDASFLGGNAFYSYNRFWPSIFVSFNDFVVSYGDLFGIGQTFFEERTRLTAGTSLVYYKLGTHLLSAFYLYERRSAESFVPPSPPLQPTLGTFSGFGFRYAYNRSTKYPGDISQEGGPRILLDFQVTDAIFGSSEPNEQIIFSGDIREYINLPLEGHVLAFRLAGGIAVGDRLLQGTFRLGSATGESVISGPTPRLFTLRGLPQITFAGERALLASGEYRLPLIYPQRGPGTWPIFLNKMYMVFFADWGSVWNGGIDFNNFLLGVGAELRGDFVFFYGLPLTLRLGYGIIVDGREFIQGLTDPVTGLPLTAGTLILEFGTSF